jgi:predicted house-cleaning NTP pyrophosphatase (Maf/HAM1 superfamily)
MSYCYVLLLQKNQKLLVKQLELLFSELSNDAIWNYINNFKPFDKAGALRIQEWIGLVGISKSGSYTNVVGLPAGKSLSLSIAGRITKQLLKNITFIHVTLSLIAI